MFPRMEMLENFDQAMTENVRACLGILLLYVADTPACVCIPIDRYLLSIGEPGTCVATGSAVFLELIALYVHFTVGER